MGRTGGDRTRQRILEAAEELFSKNGFHATSVSQITKRAMVNKAALYYHFKDKNDLIASLFQKMLDDYSHSDVFGAGQADHEKGAPDVRTAMRGELSFLEKRKDILAVMLMESFKSHDADTSLFQCIQVAMKPILDKRHSLERLVHEFFTGFIPLLAFVVLKDRWCDYFGYDEEEVVEQFVESFIAAHVETHPGGQRTDSS